MSSPRPECHEVHAELGEFALGVLGGRARARVLEHVNECAACRGDVEALTGVGDLLVSLVPEREPPLGFESRLVARYLGASRASRRPGWRWWGLAAAALMLLLGGVALGDGGDHGASYTSAGAPHGAALVSHGHSVGHLWMSAGAPAWIYVSFEDGRSTGVAWCSVTLRDGRVLEVGVFRLHDGYGAWSARVNAASGDVRSARVTADAGRVLATATLSA